MENNNNKQFTDDELYMLSDGILALIRNTNQALQLTSDKSCIEALENLNKKYRELNTKICGMLEQKGVNIMSNLTHLFKVGQKVTYRNNDFDAVKRNIPCVVKETYPDHIIITDTETDTDLWIEEGFNMDCVFPEYNMIGG